MNGLPYLVVDLPIPSKRLHPNHKPASRAGAMARGREVKAARQEAAWAFTVARRAKSLSIRDRVVWQPTFYYKVIRDRDDDGLTGSLKSYRDGFADALLIFNDKGIKNLSPIEKIDRNIKQPYVKIEVFDVRGEKP